MAEDRRIIHEITPLMGKDVLYIADRHKKEFTYPIHNHSVYELNFVENAKGVRRIVGDSQEVIGDYDLCLITSPDLEHVWEQNECHSDDIREITVQFDFSMSDETLFGRNPYASITRMMQEAKKGLVFPMQAIMKVYGMLDTLSSVKDGFYAVQQFLTILYELSRCENARTLASSSYAKVTVEDDSRRILKVKNFISKNYMDELRLPELASLAGMSSSAFSRFFKLHTGRNISEYIIDLRLGIAGGPIVMGILIGALGPRVHFISYMTRSAGLMLRELGLALYLGCLGLAAGGQFFETVVRPEGLMWSRSCRSRPWAASCQRSS